MAAQRSRVLGVHSESSSTGDTSRRSILAQPYTAAALAKLAQDDGPERGKVLRLVATVRAAWQRAEALEKRLLQLERSAAANERKAVALTEALRLRKSEPVEEAGPVEPSEGQVLGVELAELGVSAAVWAQEYFRYRRRPKSRREYARARRQASG